MSMSAKRDFEDADDGETPAPRPKRPRTQSSKTRQHQNSGIDPTWGQKYVFSGLGNASTIPEGEESDFEDDVDAMAYLMSVRQQASSIPHLLVAPKVQIGPQLPTGLQPDQATEGEKEDEVEGDTCISCEADSRGWYEDGAYIGLPEGWESNKGEEGKPAAGDGPGRCEKALQEAYFAAVMDRYLHLRTNLHSRVPENGASRLSKCQVTGAGPFGRYSSTAKVWSPLIRNRDPHPIQIALLSKDSVVRIIRVILGGNFLRRGHSIPERTSQWLWALLARLPDIGELNHTEIGWVRDLGRRAVLLGRTLADMAALREELTETGFDLNDAVDASSSDEDVVGEDVDDGAEAADAPDAPDAEGHVPDTTAAPAAAIPPVDVEAEEGEVDENDEGDAAMDLASDSEADEGEVTEKADGTAALEEAKRGLLAKLVEAEEERRQDDVKQRARMNMRATLNMVLTVVGDFYGQRDLLEFREPFVGA